MEAETNIQKSEKRPLLPATHDKTTAFKSGIQKWVTIFFVIMTSVLYMASLILCTYVMSQYSYKAFMRQTFPNSSHNYTGSQSPCNQNTNTTAYKEQIVVQKLSSEWNIYAMLVSYNIVGIIFTLNLATYSDVYGRKILFIPPFIGNVLKTALCSVGIYFEINIEWFILFYAIEGCTGSWVSLLSMVYSCISDITEAGKPRSVVIGLLEAGIGVGTFLTTTFSGYLIKWTDGFFYPSVISCAITLIGLIIVVFILPETLQESKKRDKAPNICENLFRVTECYRPNFSQFGKQWMFIVLLLIFLTSAVPNIGRINVETLYQLNAPFCWCAVRIGWYGAMRMASISIGGFLLIKIFHCFTSDEYIALAGCVTTVASLVLVGLSNTDRMLYIALAAGTGNAVTMAMVRSIMSRISPVHKQGSVFAGIAAAEMIFSMASSVGYSAIYDATVSTYRGMTFLIMAGFGVVGIILCLALIIGQPVSKAYNVTDIIVSEPPDKNDLDENNIQEKHRPSKS